jgi:hypothetical protein
MDSYFPYFILLLVYLIILNQLYSKNQIILENLFLKTQLASFKRRYKIFHTSPIERVKLLAFSFLLTNWKQSLILVTPETLLLWRKAPCLPSSRPVASLVCKSRCGGKHFARWTKSNYPGRTSTIFILIVLLWKIYSQYIPLTSKKYIVFSFTCTFRQDESFIMTSILIQQHHGFVEFWSFRLEKPFNLNFQLNILSLTTTLCLVNASHAS